VILFPLLRSQSGTTE